MRQVTEQARIYYTGLALTKFEDFQGLVEMNNTPEKAVYVELEPDLEACIETRARQQFNRIAGELLKEGGEGKLAVKLEVLRLFLESADFKKLRSESEKYLTEGKKVKFRVYLENGKPGYTMEVTQKE